MTPRRAPSGGSSSSSPDRSPDLTPQALKHTSGLVAALRTERTQHDAQLALNAIGAYAAQRPDRASLQLRLARLELLMPEHAEPFAAVRAYFALSPLPGAQRTPFRVPARINAHRPESWLRASSPSARVPGAPRSGGQRSVSAASVSSVSSASSEASSASESSQSSQASQASLELPPPPPLPTLRPPPSAHTRAPRTCDPLTPAQAMAASWRPPPAFPLAHCRLDLTPVGVRA